MVSTPDRTHAGLVREGSIPPVMRTGIRPAFLEAVGFTALTTAVLALWVWFSLPRLSSAGAYPAALLAEEAAVLLVPMIVLPALYVRWRYGWGLREFGLSLRASWRWWAIAAAAGVAWSVLTTGASAPAPLAFLALSLWQPAVAEELFSRGIVQGRLVRVLRPIFAVGLGAALFATMHLVGDLAGIGFGGSMPVNGAVLGVGFAFRFGVGFVLGELYRRAGSLGPPIILHYLLDFGGPILAGIA